MQPYEDVVTSFRRRTWAAPTSLEKLLERFEYQIRDTYPNRLAPPRSREQVSWKNIRLGLVVLRNIFWKVGVLGDYKLQFWKFALRRLARGEIEYLISSILVAHHSDPVRARGLGRSSENASNYSMRLREASVPAE